MILIFLLIIIIYIYIKFYRNNVLKENFQIKIIRDLNKKLEKYHTKKTKINDSLMKNDPKKKLIKDNNIVITGATSGLGYEIAKMLNKYKPTLVLCGKKKEKVLKMVESFSKFNDNVYGVWEDLSKKDGAKNVYNSILSHVNTIDILINNAIIKKGSRFLMSKDEKDWLEEISVNINGNILLSQKIAYKMKTRGVKGRIINISSDVSKLVSSDTNSGSEILMKNMIEKFSKILADELYSNNIAVTTIRIDHNVSNDKGILNLDNSSYNYYFKNLFGTSLDKLMPVFMYAIKAPLYEISGKIISTTSYLENPNLSKIISSYPIQLAKTFKKYKFPKHTKDKSVTYLVKQNPYKMSPKIKDILDSKQLHNINDVSKYKSILDSVIAKNLNIKSNSIIFFKTEYNAIKKIIDIFVPKYQNIIVTNPIWNILKLVEVENKINIDYVTLNDVNNKLVPDYNSIIDLINTRTKLIYLSSPNIISGQSLDIETFNKFIKNIPKNIIILLDQRYLEFSDKKTNLFDGKNYIDKFKNIIVLRSFNNFYSIENLELSYIITNKELSKVIKNTIVINQLDRFNEQLALNVYRDNYYENIKKKMYNEKKRIILLLKKNNIKYYPSEVFFLLVKTNKSKKQIVEELEKRNIILYSSNDDYNDYWTLPLGTKKINNSIIDSLLYSNL